MLLGSWDMFLKNLTALQKKRDLSTFRYLCCSLLYILNFCTCVLWDKSFNCKYCWDLVQESPQLLFDLFVLFHDFTFATHDEPSLVVFIILHTLMMAISICNSRIRIALLCLIFHQARIRKVPNLLKHLNSVTILLSEQDEDRVVRRLQAIWSKDSSCTEASSFWIPFWILWFQTPLFDYPCHDQKLILYLSMYFRLWILSYLTKC